MAYISALELFSVGIGPSSSHTVGPMRAASTFVSLLRRRGVLDEVESIGVVLCGSLGATGEGHGTPDAVVAGLRGLDPRTCDVDEVPGAWDALGEGAVLVLDGGRAITMRRADIRLAPLTRLPGHPNGMRFTASASGGPGPGAADRVVLADEVAYSVGGGFVLWEDALVDGVDTELSAVISDPAPCPAPDPSLAFDSAAQLLEVCRRTGLDIAEVAWAHETALMPATSAPSAPSAPTTAVATGLDEIWSAMSACIDSGLVGEGRLPGRLNVRRRAARTRIRLEALEDAAARGEGVVDLSIEWLQAYAMAVNEENASGRRVVTAPTNGAAGIVPAVGRHFLRTHPAIADDEEAARRAMRRYLLVAGAIGNLYKRNASISGAEAGCQGEVGSACSMAAGALCAVLGGTPEQVENAAEIAMEHNLGLTCDPVGGLVQVPCIERNAIAACTAVSAARLALQGDGSHVVSLDTVIETMRQTGLDMSTKYKETSTGGLAVNVIEC